MIEGHIMLEKAREILGRTPLIDGHNDLPWQYRARVANHVDRINLEADTSGLEPTMHTDIPRLREGMVGAQFWSLYIPVEYDAPGAAKILFEQIDVTMRIIERYADVFELARSAADIERIVATGKIASVLAIEGGHSIENSLPVLRQAHAVGARYMTLTHNNNIAWADSATDEPKHGGLTSFGREVVREMNRLGMMVDLSHVAPATMHDALDVSEAPIIFSHSGARSICDHPRNVPDEVLQRVRDCNGIVMATFVPSFISEEARAHRAEAEVEEARLKEAGLDAAEIEKRVLEEWLIEHPMPSATLQQVADHIDHLREIAGIDHIGIGSDFDGIRAVPVGLEDVSKYPALVAELLERGYSEAEVAKIVGRNLLRVMREVEQTGARLRRFRPPSDALIDDLTGNASAR